MLHLFSKGLYHQLDNELTLGCRETLVMSWRSTRVQVMKKMFRRQEASGAYQRYIKQIPTMLTTYAAVAINIT